MSIILAILFAAILILVGLLWPRHARKPVTQVLVRRYVHPGHGWLRMTEDGDVLVGMDDFAQSVIGSIDSITLPRLLKRVNQGGIAWEVSHGARSLKMVSPVSGRVIEKNEMVLNNPSLINNSPYGDGWLFKVHPTKLSPQLHNLLTGKTVAEWQETVRTHLTLFFSATPALMYQDGGELVEVLPHARRARQPGLRVGTELLLGGPAGLRLLVELVPPGGAPGRARGAAICRSGTRSPRTPGAPASCRGSCRGRAASRRGR